MFTHQKWFLGGVFIGITLFILFYFTQKAKAETYYKPVDVALLLAIDVSGSVSDENWKLQRQGIVDVLMSKRFEEVRKINFIGRMAIGVMQWGTMAHESIPMMLIEDGTDLLRLALQVDKMERAESDMTFMGPMFKKAAEILEPWSYYATRMVVDVSGDGESNGGIEPEPFRQALLDAGVTINALPIITSLEPKLDEYYEKHVMGGPGSFLVVAYGEKDFARAFIKKFISEIALNR